MLLFDLVMSNQQDNASNTSMNATVKQVLNKAMSRLQNQVDDPYTDSHVLLAHFMDTSRAWLVAHADDVIDQSTIAGFMRLVEQRRQGRPVAYITGMREFWSLSFKVTEATLIPRPETEHLVEQALLLLPGNHAQVLDYGTGSGIMAVVLAKERPHWQLHAVECSPGALSVARQNAEYHQVAVRFHQACGLEAFDNHCFDMIVSNPPYVMEADKHLRQGDVRFEPRLALASGADGLDCISYLVANAGDYLRPGGYLLLEHGYDQVVAVQELMAEHGYSSITSVKDLAGHDRVTSAQWPAQ